MSKTLLIMRHAHTEPFSENGQDHSRNLTASGFEAAGKMGERMMANHYVPDHIYCSTAARTRQTLEAVSPNFPTPPPMVSYHDEIYLASENNLLDLIHTFPSEQSFAMLIGHNPGLPTLIQLLTGEFMTQFSPGTVALLKAEVDDWQMIAPKGVGLVDVLVPV